MWLSSEDARSDFVLAVAALVLGNQFVRGVLWPIPFYPVTGTAGLVLSLFWVTVLAIGIPLMLARWRNQVPGAFGIDGPVSRDLAVGVVAVAPLFIAHLVPFALEGDFGSLARATLGQYAISLPSVGTDIPLGDRLYQLGRITAVAVGAWLLASLLVVRARDAFRSPDMDLTEVVRTFGMGAVGATFVLGVLNIGRGYTFGNTMRVTIAILALVLLTDQYIPARRTTTRATLVGPAIAVAVMHVLAAGGLFRGDLLLGLYTAAASGAVVLCAGALIEAKRGGAAAVLLVGSAIWGFPLLAQPVPEMLLNV